MAEAVGTQRVLLRVGRILFESAFYDLVLSPPVICKEHGPVRVVAKFRQPAACPLDRVCKHVAQIFDRSAE